MFIHSKSRKNDKFLLIKIISIILAIILLGIVITYLLSILKKRNNFQNAFFDCKIQVTEIDPRIADNYKVFQDKVAKCGPCQNGKVDITVSSCPTTETGIGENNEYCNPKISVMGYNDSNIDYIYKIDPDNLSKFLCLPL